MKGREALISTPIRIKGLSPRLKRTNYLMSSLEEFQSELEALPHILQKKYALLRELDQSLEDLRRQNEQRCEHEIEDLKRGIRTGTIAQDKSVLRFSDDALEEQKHCLSIADEKVALAVQAYDLVDSHIQQLDQYMKKINDQLQREKDSSASTGLSASTLDGTAKSGRSGEGGRGGRKKTRVTNVESTEAETTAGNMNPSGMDLDLPVDPNEPTYCFCNQVSYGEMVACDNPDCKIEWFHFGCVGLKERPRGKWYCSDCVGMKGGRRKGR
ncbi:hypothetical protein MLD38_021337 [Melastoma candidum]|uniref:Uncharacterized protein n=1 Tax=Melastoma candidum TaxID=119954 RepID=A0ACB9QJM6_9MYRT|nr:hypothetical protein MLD38_021337 [Melastoma candidum]